MQLKSGLGLKLCLILLLYLPCRSANILGGDITWDCNGAGDFIFKLRLHVQCGSGVALPVSYNLSVFNNPGLNSIPVNLVSPTDISPTCGSSGTTITCISGGPGAVSEYIYQSAPINLVGVPPPGGWVFTFTDCCRSANTNLNTSASSGTTIYSKMFSLGGNAFPCADNSPDFLSYPETILCTGSPASVNFNAFDADLDSISVKWSEPLDDFTGAFTPPSNPPGINFNSAYDFTNPFPNPLSGSGNVGATLNSTNGAITFTAQQTGSFTYALLFESWRCGQKIAEIHKEFQIALNNCGTNVPPTLSAPFAGMYETTVTAGTLINFTLNSTDNAGQNILWEAYSDEFGLGYTNASTGCAQPPCATLSSPPPSPAAGANSLTFNWQTDCAHLGSSSNCSVSKKTYRFYITAKDDVCPVPAINNKAIVIHVAPPNVLASPPIKCISVDAAGNVTLTWTLTPDPSNSFDHYAIYSSQSANGNFSPVASIANYNQTQYTIPAGVNVTSSYYFIKAFGCNGFAGSAPADTARPIQLTVNNPANGYAQLFWNPPFSPLPTSSCGWYRIYKEYPAGVWTLIDSTQSLTYTDTISVCTAQLNYRVEICDNSGCSSVSTIDGDIFMDQIDPDTPLLDSVSMNLAGDAVLGWNLSNAQDVIGYYIFQLVGGVYNPIDTIYNTAQTSYTNIFSNAGGGSETYAIASFDSCGNISNLGAPQNSIYLSASYNVCGYSTALSWNSYTNMQDGGLAGYHVLCSVNGSAFTSLGFVQGISFVHTGLVPGSTYCYYVQAFSDGGQITSTSNRECLLAGAPNQPSFLYLSRVTVNALQQIEADCFIDNSPSVTVAGIELYRSPSKTQTFEKVAWVNFNGSSTYTMTDNAVDPSKQSYYYFLLAKDSCNNPSIRSDTSVTVHCTAMANDNFTNTIIWTDYEKWLGGISGYNIYRSVNGFFDPSPVGNVVFSGAGSYSFIDNIESLTPEEGEFVYYVEATEGAGNPHGFSAVSHSNYAHVYREAEIFVPNAFAPKGVNTIFLPVTQFVDKTDYHLMIFDRWGQKIWETTDDQTGWSGDGKESGVYVWLIQYKDAKGEFVERRGSVTLIR